MYAYFVGIMALYLPTLALVSALYRRFILKKRSSN
jgi:hypothetical protein